MTTYNGITLRADSGPYIVTAISPTQHFYTDTALTAAVTLPATITTTTPWYCAPGYANTAYTFTVTQVDGSDISPGALMVGTTDDTFLRPEPRRDQLAADVGPVTNRYVTGNYYFASNFQSGVTTGAAAVGSLNLLPYRVVSDVTIAKLGMEVTGAGGAGSVIRLGIYADDGSGYPGALVVDAGTIDGTSATVQEITLGTPQALTRGLYWFGAAGQVGTQATIRTSSPQINPSVAARLGTTAPTAALNFYGYKQASVTGALPASFSTTVTAADCNPRLFFKVS